MKTTFKSVVAGLSLAFVSTPLFAAPVARVEKAIKVETITPVLKAPLLLADCTATAEVSVGGISVSLSVTASTCGAAIRDLMSQIAALGK